MTHRLVIRPRAVLDVAGFFGQIAANRPAAALRFYDAFEVALKLIDQMPDAGGRLLLEELAQYDWRYVRPKGFRKYLIFYQITATTLEVVRVLHSSRDLTAALRDV